VTMTCLNGYFHDAALDSLAEALLHADGGGAVAVWAPSGITGPSGQSVMNQELFRWVFSERDSPGAPLRLGEAVVRAKAAVGDDDVRRTWILLGDPSMPLPF
jgi:Peptidase family C25